MIRTITLFALFLTLPGCAGMFSTSQPEEPTPEERRTAWVKAHPDVDQSVKTAVLEGRVMEGMSELEVKASLGRPDVVAISDLPEGDTLWRYRITRTVTHTDYRPGGPVEWEEEVDSGEHYIVFAGGQVINVRTYR